MAGRPGLLACLGKKLLLVRVTCQKHAQFFLRLFFIFGLVGWLFPVWVEDKTEVNYVLLIVMAECLDWCRPQKKRMFPSLSIAPFINTLLCGRPSFFASFIGEDDWPERNKSCQGTTRLYALNIVLTQNNSLSVFST